MCEKVSATERTGSDLTEALFSGFVKMSCVTMQRRKWSVMADDQRAQSERFEQAARELGCDEDPERSKETVRKLAKSPPAQGPSKGKAKR